MAGKRSSDKKRNMKPALPSRSSGSPALSADMSPLVPQPHGGALYAGGVPGHRGGGGRPPSELKARIRERCASFMEEEGVAIVQDIAREGTHDSDRLKAVQLAASLGELTLVPGGGGGAFNLQVAVLAAPRPQAPDDREPIA